MDPMQLWSAPAAFERRLAAHNRKLNRGKVLNINIIDTWCAPLPGALQLSLRPRICGTQVCMPASVRRLP